MVKEMVGNQYLYFADGIQVQLNENSAPFYAWAVSVSPNDNLYVMDAEEEWHKLELEDVNSDNMLYYLNKYIIKMHQNFKPLNSKNNGNSSPHQST
jgi:hypothetical protein